MPRRVSLPAADELFRTTGGSAVQPSAQPRPGRQSGDEARVPAPAGEPARERVDEHAAAADDAPSANSEHAEEAAPSEHGGPGRRQARGALPSQSSVQSSGRNSGRGTGDAAAQDRRTAAPADARATPQPKPGQASSGTPRRGRAARRPSGRERHDEKITVYVSAEELMDLEHARLVLRGEHGLAVDRGRVVREAVAVVLADLEARGDASILVRRLRGR